MCASTRPIVQAFTASTGEHKSDDIITLIGIFKSGWPDPIIMRRDAGTEDGGTEPRLYAVRTLETKIPCTCTLLQSQYLKFAYPPYPKPVLDLEYWSTVYCTIELRTLSWVVVMW